MDDEGGDGDDEMDLVHWDFLHVTSYRDIQKEHQEKSPGYPGWNQNTQNLFQKQKLRLKIKK